MATQEQVLKANPFILHNQSLLMARQRALRMQTLTVLVSCTISTRALTLLFPRGAATFFVPAARQCGFPRTPHSQVLPWGESRPLSVAASRHPGHSRAPARLPSPVTPGGRNTWDSCRRRRPN